MRDRDRVANWEQEGGATGVSPMRRTPAPVAAGIEREEAERRYRESGIERERRSLDAALSISAQAIAGRLGTILADAPLGDVVAAFAERDVGALAVVDDDGRLVGVLAPLAVVRALAAAPGAWAGRRARDCASPANFRLRADDPVVHVIAQCEAAGDGWLVPIVDGEDRPLALLTAGQVLRFLASVLWPRGSGGTLTPGPVASSREGG